MGASVKRVFLIVTHEFICPRAFARGPGERKLITRGFAHGRSPVGLGRGEAQQGCAHGRSPVGLGRGEAQQVCSPRAFARGPGQLSCSSRNHKPIVILMALV